MSKDRPKRADGEGDVAVEKKTRTHVPRQYKVILHNDHYTSMEFVVLVLMRFFQKSETEANHVMLTVHHKGHAVAGTYSRDVAETKVEEVHAFAQDNEMPLRLTTEPV
ncbi:MAG: ATP-dependent Clp protease adaptor ClpS [Myxococcales bacterium]|nr:ATP-dependent Clp protease adaptor ClpS [Myxococcales bacterium]